MTRDNLKNRAVRFSDKQWDWITTTAKKENTNSVSKTITASEIVRRSVEAMMANK